MSESLGCRSSVRANECRFVGDSMASSSLAEPIYPERLTSIEDPGPHLDPFCEIPLS